MCTLLAWKGIHPRYPLIVAANRDEFEGRPSTPPQVLEKDPHIVGGRDEIAGGTWLAVSEPGIIVALANRRGAGSHDQSKLSRGRLVLELVRLQTLDELRRALERVDPHAYNPFILLAADAHRGIVAHGGDPGLTLTDLSNRAHAMTNWDLDAEQPPKAARAKRIARDFDPGTHADPAELAAQIHRLLGDHAAGPTGNDGGLCVHRPAQRYGTRSSSIVILADPFADTRYYHAEGKACESTLVDVSHLLAAPAAGARVSAGTRPAATQGRPLPK